MNCLRLQNHSKCSTVESNSRTYD